MCLFFTASAAAATYTVTKTADTNDGVCDTDCSLREAIVVANGTAANDIIEFSSSVFGTAQTITLSGSALTIANNGTLTINGTGATLLTVSGNNVIQVFLVNSGATAEISGLTVMAARNNGGNGGGIVANSTSTLTLRNLGITGNFASSGGGLLAQSGSTVNLSYSTVSNNDSLRANGSLGGGIQNNLGTMNISHSTFTGNNAGFGGGIFNNGSMTISNSTFSGNTANNGAAIANGASFTGGNSTITINNSTISGNTASSQGGGLYNVTSSAATNTGTLNSVTISGNTSAASQGGGIFNTGVLTLNNSLSANSTAGGDCVRTSGTANATYSLIEDALTCVNGTNSNNLTGDPNLGALQNNGGATSTHALLTGSIVIDKGNSALTQDQRGSVRPVNDPNASNGTGNRADIGAFEVQAPGGDLDLPFAPNLSPGTVLSLAVQTDGKIIIGGIFTAVNGTARNRIARLNSDGTLDTGFQNGLTGADSSVNAVAVQADGKIIIGGQFTTVNGTARSRIARLNSDGTLDTGFLNGLSGADNTVFAVPVQADGKIVIGGFFTTVNGVARGTIARLNSDGTLDTTFQNGLSGTDGFVQAIGVQTDGKIVIGGGFNTVNGVARGNIARLNSDGTLDTGFLNGLSGASDRVRALAVQTDGKIVIGGLFTVVNNVGRVTIARLNSDGTLDTGFLNGLSGTDNGSVNAVAVQTDGKIVIGGVFNTVNGVARGNIARLNSDGALDTTFLNGLSGANSTVNAVAVQTDGNVLIGGQFIFVNGVARTGLARLLATNFAPSFLQFSATSYAVNEGAGTALITVTRMGSSDGSATVNYATSNGTATAGNDYTATSGTLTFLDGETSKTFTVPILDDVLTEPLETVNLTLSAPTGGGVTLGVPAAAAISLIDNDGLSISGRLTQGETPLADVTVTLSGAVSGTVLTNSNGDYTLSNLAFGQNYTVKAVSPYYTFAPNRADFNNLTANQTQNFSGSDVPPEIVPLMDNFSGPRDPERWSLGTLTQPPGATDPNVTVAQTNGQLVIQPVGSQTGLHYNGYASANNFDLTGGQVVLELVQAGTNGGEAIFSLGSDAQNFARFSIVSPPPNAPLRIQEVLNGVPQAPVESNMAMFMCQLVQNGVTVLNVAITYDAVAHRFLRFRHVTRDANQNPVNDLAFETSPEASVWTERARASLGERTVTGLTVELAAGTNSPASNPGPVVFDNLMTQVVSSRFDTANYTVNESAGMVTVTMRRSGLTTLTSTVDYFTVDGTAQQRSRYVASSGVITFAPGETVKSVNILLIDNQLVDGSQTFDIFLSNPTGSGVAGPGRTIITINDNDTGPITTNPLETPQLFVTQQYYDFLSRTPDQGGLDYWAGQITQCGNNAACISARRWQVSLAFFVELEFQQTGAYVYRLYRAAYGNNQPFPNPSGNADSHPYCVAQGCPFRAEHIPAYQKFVVDRARVVGGAQLAAGQLALATAFVNRAEFRQRYPTTLTGAQFVDAVLATIQASSNVNLTGQRDALIALHGTGGRGAVMYRLADDNIQNNPINNRAYIDAEYNRGFVLTQYFGYLRRDPDQPGLNFWLATVNRFPVRDLPGQNAMVCAFVTSQEYQERFSLISPRNNGECPPAP